MSETAAASAGPFPVPGLTPPTQRTGAKRRIGDVIVTLGFAEREKVEAVVSQGQGGIPLGKLLIEAGIVDSNQLAHALAERNGLDFVDLNVFEVDKGAANLIDAGKARRYRTIPIAFLGEGTLLVATADPANVLALDDITMATGYEVRRAVASPEDIDALIGQISRLGDAVEEIDHDELDGAAGADAGPRVAGQDHGRSRHRREAAAAGRPHRPDRGRPLRGLARGDTARGARRVGRHADPRQAEGPGRVRARGREAGAGEPPLRAHVRVRAAFDGPRRPGHHHGRRGARP